ncbi:unnamed protein product [Trichobilharzia regenti]|nr:unnamed protein product [Trichobilharzia regenti]
MHLFVVLSQSFRRGREFTNIIVSMSEPSSDREDNEQHRHHSIRSTKGLLRSDSLSLSKQDFKLTADDYQMAYKAVAATASGYDSDSNCYTGVKSTGNDSSNNNNNNESIGKHLDSSSTMKLHDSLSQLTENDIPTEYIRELPVFKSQRSFGYRYHQSHLILTDLTMDPISMYESADTSYAVSASSFNTCTPPAIYRPDIRFHFNDSSTEEQDEQPDHPPPPAPSRHSQVVEQEKSQLNSPKQHMCRLNLLPTTPPPPCPLSPSSVSTPSINSTISTTTSAFQRKKVPWTYIFEDVFDAEWQKSKLWGNLQFWEDSFLDAVAQERDILG